jgi:hypothetical protein
MNPCLECLIVNRPLLRQYHDRVLQLLEDAAKTALKEDWDQIFSFEVGAPRYDRTSVNGVLGRGEENCGRRVSVYLRELPRPGGPFARVFG